MSAHDRTSDVNASGNDALLELIGVRKVFKSGARSDPDAVAVDSVDLTVRPGESVGLVGESGSGKSTLGRLALRLLEPDAGQIVFDGRDITNVKGGELRRLRSEMQAVFQDISGSLNSKLTVGQLLSEPLRFHRDVARNERMPIAEELLGMVGLDRHHLGRYPYELSGGQRQRISLARALAVEPRLLVLDEPVSALDVSTQSQAINLLSDLQERLGVAYLFIAHDLFVVHHVSHRIAVMYLGAIGELGTAAQVYGHPRHPYTQALLSAIPHPDPTIERSRRRILLTGEVPSPTAVPSGCRFHTRCPYAMDVCRHEVPPVLNFDDGGTVACHLHTTGPKLEGDTVDVLIDSPSGFAPANVVS
ncbi:MAG: ABC transporter ATP-binding protein [Ilumatobacteraceae bacterium]|nr:ABC transporter ATP-binding protein [Ilumatobacteraceae bacterium]